MKSDSQIRNNVIAELTWIPSVDATHIEVDVADGLVTLNGRVASLVERWEAERSTQRLPGVQMLRNNLEVVPAATHRRSDAEIVHSIEKVLEWMTYIPHKTIKISANDGWATASGEVDWQYQKQAAACAIRHLVGITGLTNNISIKTKVSVGDLKADIEAALKRRTRADGRDIVVEVHGSDVILSGMVRCWEERTLATHAAWGTPGVHNVVDRLAVAF